MKKARKTAVVEGQAELIRQEASEGGEALEQVLAELLREHRGAVPPHVDFAACVGLVQAWLTQVRDAPDAQAMLARLSEGHALVDALTAQVQPHLAQQLLDQVLDLAKAGDGEAAQKRLEEARELAAEPALVEQVQDELAQLAVADQLQKLQTQIKALLSKDKLDAAQEKIDAAMEIDATDKQTQKLQKTLEQQQQKRVITLLHKQVKKLLEDGDLEQAQQKLDQVTALDEEDAQTAALVKELAKLQRHQQRRERVAKLQAAARKSIKQSEYDQAHEQLSEALSLDGENEQSQELMEQCRRELSQRQIQMLHEQARQAMARQDLGKAADLLEQVCGIEPDRVDTEVLLTELRQQQEKQGLRLLVEQAQALLDAGKPEKAARTIQKVHAIAPDAPELAPLWERHGHVQRHKHIAILHRDARKAMKNGKLEEASALIEEARQLEPDDARHKELLEELLSQQSKQIEQLRSQASELVAQGELEQAIEKLEQVLSYDPDDAKALSLRDDVRALMESRDEDADGEAIEAEVLDVDIEVVEPGQSRRGAEAPFEASGAADLAGQTHLELPAIDDDELEQAVLEAKLPQSADDDEYLEEATPIEEIVELEEDDTELAQGNWEAQAQEEEQEAQPVAVPAQGYKYFWSVTTELDVPVGHPLPYAMEQSIRTPKVPISRDVVMFYPSIFGEFPGRGLHEMFYRVGGPERSTGGNYARWQERLEDWLRRHERKLAIYLEKVFAKRSDYHYGLIGRGNWNFIAELTPNQRSSNDDPLANDADFLDDWEDFIGAVNVTWDETFLAQFGMTPPERTKGMADLYGTNSVRRKTARKDILKRSWLHFAKVFHLSTLKTCKRMCPDIKWGFMGYPNTPYITSTDDSDKIVQCRYFNDQLQWLWEAQDVILPNFSAPRITVPDGKTPDAAQKENAIAEDRANLEVNIREAVRLRDAYAPGKPILSLHNWTYPANIGGGVLNDINMAHQFQLPLSLGADGIIINGHIIDKGQKAVLQKELTGRLGKLLEASAGGVSAAS